jgi:ubiquinone biosynthesis protein UbiJ
LKLSRVPAATAADTQICGGLFSLLSLTASRPEASIQRGDVAIRGDAELAQKFQELTRLLRPDFEEELSLVLGDVPAHQIGRLARTVSGWTRRAAWTTVRNVAEYLAHERRELVSRNEAEPFLRDIDTLREDVDRLGARIDSLSR